ncbi:MAG: hypothetical protein Q9M94_04365 [Candidatus Gracilibacteria bacterium]|nr:hypothetical protein [Candidatus Gracilibacteria bacterium]MDQ7022853.1 hypothetical protein [Candidatus Gracilibacteria bacterium]
MKNNTKKASILLWAVMLSLIISITFIAISAKINKNIKLSGEINTFIEEKNNINLSIEDGVNKNISENKALIFDNNKKQVFSLKKQEKINLSFSGDENFSIIIGIIKGSEIKFNYLNNNILTNSGIIKYSKTFTGELDSTNNTGSLVIENLGGYSSFLIKSENSFETSQKNYKIVTKIGNNFFNETKNAK